MSFLLRSLALPVGVRSDSQLGVGQKNEKKKQTLLNKYQVLLERIEFFPVRREQKDAAESNSLFACTNWASETPSGSDEEFLGQLPCKVTVLAACVFRKRNAAGMRRQQLQFYSKFTMF